MGKYKPGDKFILEITEEDRESRLQGYPHTAYLVKGMDGAFSENILDKLERPMVTEPARTNADRIRSMSDEELAMVIMCPYDTAGDDEDIMPCIKIPFEDAPDSKTCMECTMAWLRRQSKE